MFEQRRRGTTRWGTIVLVALGCSALAGCASAPADPPAAVPSPTETIQHGAHHGTEVDQPPPFLVRYGLTELRLEAFTYCVANGCVDGFDEDPPAVGSPRELLVYVPVAEFDQLQVSQVEGGDPCSGRTVAAEASQLGDGWWSVRPSGPAAEYQVDLFASGSGAGDMVASLLWTTPEDEPLPDPTATLALVVDHDGVPDSYGLELSIGNLTATPEQYAATITTTAANGESLTFSAIVAEDCRPEGSLFFDEPDADAKRAAALGDFPFRYRVDLVLDGVAYVGTATYPDDLADPQDVSVPLHFEPELP